MQTTLGVGLGTLFFLLIPGLAGLKAFLHTYVSLDDLSRIDKLALGLVIGGILLGCSLLLLNRECWVQNPLWSQWQSKPPDYGDTLGETEWCEGNDVATLESLQSTPLIVIISLIAVESVIGVVIFGALGWLFNRVSDGPPREAKFIEQPWEFASKMTAREKEYATVITSGGEEVTGRIHRIGAPSEDYDLLLEGPEKVIRDPKDRVTHRRELGSFSYHHYRDISQIRFRSLGDDPGSSESKLSQKLMDKVKSLSDQKVDQNDSIGDVEDADYVNFVVDFEQGSLTDASRERENISDDEGSGQ